MNTQQECPECPGNANLSWQEPAVIQLYGSEVFGANCDSGTTALFNCTSGGWAELSCKAGTDGI